MALRVFSYGGGVQSTAALVLAAQGKIDFKTFLFANVGDDSEHPATLRYVREVAMPYAEREGIAVEEVRYWGDGKRTLYERLTTLGPKGGQFIGIPLRLSRTGKPGMRTCTSDYKILIISKRLKELGATKDTPAVVGLGISLDEMQRARTPFDPRSPEQWRIYPLIEQRLTRQDCIRIIERAGVEVPPKSSCWFCPYHSKRAWQGMRDNEPELFQKSVELERGINERLAAQGQDPVWLSDWLAPLDQATSPHRQLPMFSMNERVSDEDAARILNGEIVYGQDFGIFDDAEDACESGFCMV